MTVIAWDGKILAADKMFSFGGNTKYAGCKIGRDKVQSGDVEIEYLWGLCGEESLTRIFMDWFKNSNNPKDFPDRLYEKEYSWGVVIISKYKDIDIETDHVISYFSSGPFADIIESQYFATGSGRDFALAAMHCGKNAIDAVTLASDLSVSCGMGYDALRLI